MREFLQNQIKGNSSNQTHEKRTIFENEKNLVNQAVKKVQVREQAREYWVRQQLKNSNYLNRLNSLYKNQTGIESEENPEKTTDFQTDQGLNLMLSGITDRHKIH